ncbi:unnamed protein product [Penicillium roqueforti FM164]|uniref:Genomic scaffold, ProqFM164S01 n=1 Tax=Penicillium roqueforti (strain FM164) TaxID=1365484 RepID=W6PZE5_PENRF|nr:unnamed protein product [Penicillium roqueforti FM164]
MSSPRAYFGRPGNPSPHPPYLPILY